MDDGQFNGQPVPTGRGQPMPGQQMPQMPGGPNGMAMQLPNGLPADMNAMNFAQNGQQNAVAPQGMDGMYELDN